MTRPDARPFAPDSLAERRGCSAETVRAMIRTARKIRRSAQNAMLSKGGSGGFAADPDSRRSSEPKSKPQVVASNLQKVQNTRKAHISY